MSANYVERPSWQRLHPTLALPPSPPTSIPTVAPIVVASHLTKRFGKFIAVDDVSFAIAPGEVFGLLGPNGAGKTTVIRMLITLIPPTSGEVRISGLDVRRDAARIRRVLGCVPQGLSADGMLTGYENLLIIAELLALPRRERERRIQEVLGQMDLEPFADRLVRDYSGGMIRRLEIGQAILHRPVSSSLTSPPSDSIPPRATRSGRLSRRSGRTPI